MTSPDYKWIVLSNTTIGMLLATINSSILLIALPDIFRGIHINPLAPAFTFSFIACFVAAGASWLRGGKYHYHEPAEGAEAGRSPDAGTGPAAAALTLRRERARSDPSAAMSRPSSGSRSGRPAR